MCKVLATVPIAKDINKGRFYIYVYIHIYMNTYIYIHIYINL